MKSCHGNAGLVVIDVPMWIVHHFAQVSPALTQKHPRLAMPCPFTWKI
jgi:hypothetical protein